METQKYLSSGLTLAALGRDNVYVFWENQASCVRNFKCSVFTWKTERLGLHVKMEYGDRKKKYFDFESNFMFLKKIDDCSFIIKKVGLQNFVKLWEDFDFLSRFHSLRKGFIKTTDPPTLSTNPPTYRPLTHWPTDRLPSTYVKTEGENLNMLCNL